MSSITRRDFLGTTTATAFGAVWAGATRCGAALAAEPAARHAAATWYANAYRRAVIDMHIPDWDDKFLSEFDPDQYVRMLVTSRAQSIVCYCQSHVGLFNFPTEVGQQHRAWKGRNVLGELIDRCHQHEIAVQLYTSLIFDRWAGDQHPEWRIRTWDNKIQGEGGRHAVLCPNSPYREYVRAFVSEICQKFDFEGIRFDMTFWPWFCFCQYCEQRMASEVGGAIPRTIDWQDPAWVAFQRARERWLVDFARLATDTVRTLKPQASVEHQSSTYPLNWMFGVTAALAGQNDFLQGDFYGDQLQGSFVRKLLQRLTPNRPFGYETSFSVALKDHTAMKSAALLEAKASAAIADGAAFIFIDAIDPIGTVNPRAHQRMGKIFDRLMPYYSHLGGQRVDDIAIYFSPESKFDMHASGRPVSNPDTSDAHTQSAMQAASRLISRQLPLGVITKESLGDLAELKVLVLSNVNMMDREECDAIRQWVRAGGKLLATGGSSLVDKSGRRQDDFMLADVFGVSVVNADWSPRNHYIVPTAQGQSLFAEYDHKYPAFCEGYGFEVQPHDATQILATTAVPWPRHDPSRFSSIHSDPPWQWTDRPEIVRHAFGKGTAIYCSSLIENLKLLGETFVGLVRDLENRFHFEATAPPCVEVTMFLQADRQRYLLSILNFQDQLPNLPIDDIEVRLRLPENVSRIGHLPDNTPVPFSRRDDQIVFRPPRLETLQLLSVEI
jgi:hypothetical protein